MERRPEYLPWSGPVLSALEAEWFDGGVGALDIEMSSTCGLGSCVYCDSQINVGIDGELSWDELREVVRQGGELGLRWIYVCGLGEPLDDPKFWNLMSLASEMSLAFSVFTNGLAIDKRCASRLADAGVNLILKLDSFHAATFDQLLGQSGMAAQVYRGLDALLEAGFTGNGSTTPLALSIVPTRLNLHHVVDVVGFCVEHGLFPSIGELENSGRAKAALNELGLTRNELLLLKDEVEGVYGQYCRPVCPATSRSLHIDKSGFVVVDARTGLSCLWFRLEEPDLVSVGDVRVTPLRQLRELVVQRQRRLLPGIQPNGSRANVFGGCGGSELEILEAARRMGDDSREDAS